MTAFAQQFYTFAQSIHHGSRLRLAPTPSGFLHIGNALNFVLNWLAAKHIGAYSSKGAASIYLRIDDLDADRLRPAYVQDVFETLEWLQLDWEACSALPLQEEKPYLNAFPAYRKAIFQSSNTALYFQTLDRLRESGLLFACKKSRRDLADYADGYPPEFRDQGLSLDAPEVAWRIKTPPGFPMPDFIVRRRDGIPAYQIASYTDDLHCGITHIIRGADLENSTLAQQYLAEVLNERPFFEIRFLHHPLLLDERGEKISKSLGATALNQMRHAGTGPEKIFQMVGAWLGLEGNAARALLDSMQRKI